MININLFSCSNSVRGMSARRRPDGGRRKMHSYLPEGEGNKQWKKKKGTSSINWLFRDFFFYMVDMTHFQVLSHEKAPPSSTWHLGQVLSPSTSEDSWAVLKEYGKTGRITQLLSQLNCYTHSQGHLKCWDIASCVTRKNRRTQILNR